MPLRLQRSIIICGYAFSLAHLGLLAAALYLLLRGPGAPAAVLQALERLAGRHPWWAFLPKNPPGAQLLCYGVFSIFALLLFSFAANLSIAGAFHKTASPELFFLMLFLMSLCLETWRIGSLLARVSSLPEAFSTAATRVVLYGRLFGLLCLLASSLYAAGMKFGRYPLLAGGIALLALTLAVTLLVDSTAFAASFLHRLGDRRGYLAITAIILVLAVASFLAAVLIRRSPRFALAALACPLLAAGRELLGYGAGPVPATAGVLFLLAGTVLSARAVTGYYLQDLSGSQPTFPGGGTLRSRRLREG